MNHQPLRVGCSRIIRCENDIGAELIGAGVHVNRVAAMQRIFRQQRLQRRHWIVRREAGIGIVADGGRVLVAGSGAVVEIIGVNRGRDDELVRKAEDRRVGARRYPDAVARSGGEYVAVHGPAVMVGVGYARGDGREVLTVAGDCEVDGAGNVERAPVDRCGDALEHHIPAGGRGHFQERRRAQRSLRGAAIGAHLDDATIGRGLGADRDCGIAAIDRGRVRGPLRICRA